MTILPNRNDIMCIFITLVQTASMLAIYGAEKEIIGVTEPLPVKCPYCEEANTTTLTVYSKYYHILSVPVLPFAKVAAAECTKCSATRKEIQLSPELSRKVHAAQKAVRHPFRLYLLSVFLLALAMTVAFLILR